MKTKLAPKALTGLSKAALADLVWALAEEATQAPGRLADHNTTVCIIVQTFHARDLASESAYRNARGADAIPSDILALRKFAR